MVTEQEQLSFLPRDVIGHLTEYLFEVDRVLLTSLTLI